MGADAGFLMATGLVSIAVGYGDNAVLGWFRDEAVVGTYYFAYRLAVQANLIVVGNLSGVLFAALARMTEAARQARGTIAASRLLAALAVPLNLLQAAAAEPAIRLIYGDKWEASILPFQLLSIGMALALIGAPSASLLRAQGRFKLFFVWATCLSAVYLISIGAGAALGGAVGVALATVGYYATFGPAGLRLALGRHLGFWRAIGEAFVVPLLLGGLACGLGVYSRRLIPSVASSNLLSLLWIGCVSMCAYVLLLRLAFPALWRELVLRFGSIIRRTPANVGY